MNLFAQTTPDPPNPESDPSHVPSIPTDPNVEPQHSPLIEDEPPPPVRARNH